MLLYEKPDLAESLPSACNVVISDNEPMARYLMKNFVAKLGDAFGGSAAPLDGWEKHPAATESSATASSKKAKRKGMWESRGAGS